jgi:radical SAM protein with 4Fe4S-binding SPASM domain
VEVAGCVEIEHHVMHRLNEILAPYADDPLFDAVKRERASSEANNEINCGAGWRSFALNSDGTVRSCLFLTDSKKFGNLDQQNYDDVFSQQAMHLFHDAPSPGGEECRGLQPNGKVGCEYIAVCTGCFAKAFRISTTEYPECPWRAKWFPGMSLDIEEVPALIQIGRSSRVGQ